MVYVSEVLRLRVCIDKLAQFEPKPVALKRNKRSQLLLPPALIKQKALYPSISVYIYIFYHLSAFHKETASINMKNILLQLHAAKAEPETHLKDKLDSNTFEMAPLSLQLLLEETTIASPSPKADAEQRGHRKRVT